MEIPNAKLLCHSKPVKTEAASQCVRDSCPHRETNVAQHVPPGAPSSEVLAALSSQSRGTLSSIDLR